LIMGPDGIHNSDFLMDGGVAAAYWFGDLNPRTAQKFGPTTIRELIHALNGRHPQRRYGHDRHQAQRRRGARHKKRHQGKHQM